MKRTILIGLVAMPLFATVAALSNPASNVIAQSYSPPVGEQDDVKIFHVKFSSSVGIASTLQRLFSPGATTIVADDATNSIIVSSTPDNVSRVSELIAQLDQPVDPDANRTETRVIPVRFRSASALEQVVKMQLSDAGQYAINLRTNSIVINDKAERIQAATEVIAELDVDSGSLRIECWLLGHGQGDAIGDHHELSRIGGELSRMGLDGYGVFSHAAVTTLDGHEFNLSQVFSNRKLLMLEIQGNARISAATEQAILGLSAALKLSLDGTHGETSINLSTTVKSRVGDLVLLGLAPTGNDDSRPIVMVVRVSQ